MKSLPLWALKKQRAIEHRGVNKFRPGDIVMVDNSKAGGLRNHFPNGLGVVCNFTQDTTPNHSVQYEVYFKKYGPCAWFPEITLTMVKRSVE